jgi:hypothetical protein
MLPLADAFVQDLLLIFSILLSSYVPPAVTPPSAAPSVTLFARSALPAITATIKMRSHVPRAKRGPTTRVDDL